MKQHITLFYSLLAVLFACAGCSEQDMMRYGETPAVYFANQDANTSDPVTQHDSISHSFFIYGTDVTRDTVHVLIRIMGNPVDYDRPIKLVQTNAGEPDAAIAGTHYVAFDDPSIIDSVCIRAGEVRRMVPIVMLRDKSLACEQVRLEMALEANEYFRLGIDEWQTFLVTTTDEAVKPTLWDSRWKYYFGASWGTEKMRLIIQSTGYTDFDTIPSDYSYCTWLGDTAKQALLEYNAAHPDEPLCEADGTPVSFDN